MDQKYWDMISWCVYLGLPAIMFVAISLDCLADNRPLMPWRKGNGFFGKIQ